MEVQEHKACFRRWVGTVMRHPGSLAIHHILVVALCLLATRCWTDAFPGNAWLNFISWVEIPESNEPSKKWSSFFTVDPSKILSVLINRGGLLMPTSVKKELLALSKLLDAEDAKLNLIEKELILRNFTVRIPGNRESLHLGRVHLRWDSYTRPCVDIEVEDVGILVEFTNLKLTESNWNELEDAGFPPPMEYYDTEEGISAESSTFVRIRSIDLSGNVRLEISSRPLNKPIATIVYGLDTLKDLSNEILQASETNAITDRRGCKTDELYIILRTHFAGRIRNFLRDAAYDVTTGAFSDEGSTAIKQARRLLASVSDVIKTYADDAGRKKGDDLQESLAIRLEKLGLPSPREKLSALREVSLNAARNVDAKKLAAVQWERIRAAHLTTGSSSTTSGDADNALAGGSANKQRNVETIEEIIRFFPDW